MRRAIKAGSMWCCWHRHWRVKEQHRYLSKVIVGHCNYYGITGNSIQIGRFRQEVQRAWRKWLNRRSQRAKMTWARFDKLSDETVEDRACHRVQVTMDEGPFVFWIDRETYVLRKMALPTAELERRIAQNGGVSDVELVVDFRQARIGAEIDGSEFGFEMPADAKPMRAFVLPPQPLP